MTAKRKAGGGGTHVTDDRLVKDLKEVAPHQEGEDDPVDLAADPLRRLIGKRDGSRVDGSVEAECKEGDLISACTTRSWCDKPKITHSEFSPSSWLRR